MTQLIFMLAVGLSYCAHYVYLPKPEESQFQFAEEARAALCPFLGTEGMRCFDGSPVKSSGRTFASTYLQLPCGVGMSADRRSGRLIAPAIKLAYPLEGCHTVEIAYGRSRVQNFRNASQLNEPWQRSFADGMVRGGELARPSDILEYSNNYFKRDDALALSQRVIGLYTLTLNISTIELNSFARDVVSKLTPNFDPDLYEDFLDTWGTHIITKSLVDGMAEQQAIVKRCFEAGNNHILGQCIPFSDRDPSNFTCGNYASFASMILNRRLGGDMALENDYEWKITLSIGPALIQILEMVLWYDFVADESVKQNLCTIIRYRQRNIDLVQTEAVHQIDARLYQCHFGMLKRISITR
ncbi:unnamed protein product [Rotaria socialis]|uniref:MACPF domain-containing protein n=2 Tax=Rotaria socialis TaxID=392032 RepID=A0A819AMD0_9BILA|nr:unnamed protein product [Rotaria socialis]CAF3405496.1 unnamed protein product [Rotaria socialis]CAF3790008.1 unnamed protein product [Rotaria socialis]